MEEELERWAGHLIIKFSECVGGKRSTSVLYNLICEVSGFLDLIAVIV